MNEPKKSNSNLILWLVVGGFIAVALFVNAAGGSSDDDSDTPVPSQDDDPADFVDTIGGWTCEKNSSGNVTIEGRVENDHPTKALEFVRLRGRLEVEGRVINTTSSYLDSDLLRPGATSTYDIFVENPDDEDVRCFVTVESARFED